MSNTIRSKILIIEDDPGICTFLRATLTAEGYDAIVVSKGSGALEIVASHCPDCVLLDLGLPDMDGNEIISGIRQWSVMPIIVISARSMEQDKVQALDLGADDYITKPFAPTSCWRASARRCATGAPLRITTKQLCGAAITWATW